MAEALGVASSVIAVVELSVKVLSLCLQYSREVKNAKDDIERLRKEVASFKATADELKALLEGPHGKALKTSQQLVSVIENGHSTLGKLKQRLQPSTGRKAMSRFGMRALKWPFERKDVEGTIQNLEHCRTNVSLALNIDQTVILQNVDDRMTLNQLPIAHGASFDSKVEEHNPTCLPNTHQELLDDIDHWIDDPNSETVYWLNGMAGTGKSTIARTVAHSRSKRGDLGASFFFKRGEMDRGNLNKVMSTLAHQLALSIPGVAFFIKKALDNNPAVVGKSAKEQFEKLIQEPLCEAAAIATTPSSIVMVIDALDECDQETDIRLLINIFSKVQTIQPHLRIFLTSRPELPIRLGFSEVRGFYQGVVLHDIPAQIVEHDIIVFLNNEFKKIRHDFNMTVGDERKLPSDWPGRPTVQSLAKMAVPLFIFAATVCRFIGDRRRSPQRRLQTVLGHGERSHGSQLDQTYAPILRSQITSLPKEEREEIIRDFRVIVGSIVTLASPLSVIALSCLIDVPLEAMDERLDALHSVLSIPLERTIPVRLLHLSFRDYLIAEESEFQRNTACALCVTLCGRTYAACLSQMEHNPNLDDDNEVYDFLSTHFLHWVEAMSLLGRVKECLESLRSLARRLEIYSCLIFAPSKSIIRRTFEQAIPRWISNLPKVEETWDACLLTLEGHSKSVRSVVFSHDSKKVASGSNDKTIRIWDAETGQCERLLKGHSGDISSVVFSHDLKNVAITSYEESIWIWNAEMGKCKRVLKGHSDDISSVVFLYDSKKVASGSYDETIRIWDAETGICERVLKGYNSWVRSVVFSYNSKKVASVSNDEMIWIWDAETGKCKQVLKGHNSRVRSVVFSHNSKKVASASNDETVRIWNVETASSDGIIRIWDAEMGECERVLEDHGEWISSVVFSYDSKKIASASYDETVRIWDAETGECERVLEGHSDDIGSVVFSHDSKKVASGSDDETIRIWNAETGL
ncbi:unnamed protein product [Fusarium venenatum]|uniref:Nephrocystin 3-like N-terminal domain-containing protein n=1 Tax=Fusarium venenatum TaxID=56646 RepID=A0A2L2TIZ9_9HYPO|nr:uncharacterized protein FVRRES_11019 [Fusarium venenatum]CEI70942.1 unnamed protein product [Fusarium venenatum]